MVSTADYFLTAASTNEVYCLAKLIVSTSRCVVTSDVVMKQIKRYRC